MNLFEERKEKSIKDLSVTELRKRREAAKRKEEREKKKEKQKEESQSYRKYQERVQAHKEKRLAWQQERSKLKDVLRQKREKEIQSREKGQKIQSALNIKPEAHSSKDTDPTAARKSFSNLGRLLGGVAKIGAMSLADRIQAKREKKQENPEKKQQDKKPFKAPSPPPIRFKGKRTTPNKHFYTPNPWKTSAIKPQDSSKSQSPIKPVKVSVIPQTKLPPAKKPRIAGLLPPVKEEFIYSCWREEFLNELGDLRRKSKDKKNDSTEEPIGPMTGENKIILNPTTSEAFRTYSKLLEDSNGASIFAKATPPLKKRTTPMSDIYLSKQPGKQTAEQVRDKISKMFMGSRCFDFNFDLSRNTSKKSIANEAYDEGHLETFRQHSQERFTSDENNSKDAERKKRVRAALANLNPNPPKKKKKKKNKESVG